MKRLPLLALVLLLFFVLVSLGPAYAAVPRTQPPPRPSNRSRAHDANADQELLTSNPRSSSGSCGVERWSVKTGTDADVSLIHLQSVAPTTIAALSSLPTPSTLPASTRIQPTETTVFQLHDTLTQYKLESDSDYHLILADASGNTMIVEIPDPACVGSSSPWLPEIQKARSAFDARYTPSESFQAANVPVTGVGFFDFLHGQAGVAPNGIELHAVLDVQFGPSGTPTPTSTGTPTATNLIPRGGFEASGSWISTGNPVLTTGSPSSAVQ